MDIKWSIDCWNFLHFWINNPPSASLCWRRIMSYRNTLAALTAAWKLSESLWSRLRRLFWSPPTVSDWLLGAAALPSFVSTPVLLPIITVSTCCCCQTCTTKLGTVCGATLLQAWDIQSAGEKKVGGNGRPTKFAAPRVWVMPAGTATVCTKGKPPDGSNPTLGSCPIKKDPCNTGNSTPRPLKALVSGTLFLTSVGGESPWSFSSRLSPF